MVTRGGFTFFWLSFLAACGELASSDYAGDALFVVEGDILSLENLAQPDGESYVSVIWLNLESGLGVVQPQTAPVTSTGFPNKFTLPLRDEPPSEALESFAPPSCIEPVRATILAEYADYPLPSNGDVPDWDLLNELSFVWQNVELGVDFLKEYAELLDMQFVRLEELGVVPQTQADMEELVSCMNLALRLLEVPDYLEKDFSGFIGYGYIAVYQDNDGDGTLNHALEELWISLGVVSEGMEDPGSDALLGISSTHMLIFKKDWSEDVENATPDADSLITNVDGLKEGFNLARHVCGAEGSGMNHLEIVSDERTTILSINAVSEDPSLCQNLITFE